MSVNFLFCFYDGFCESTDFVLEFSKLRFYSVILHKILVSCCEFIIEAFENWLIIWWIRHEEVLKSFLSLNIRAILPNTGALGGRVIFGPSVFWSFWPNPVFCCFHSVLLIWFWFDDPWCIWPCIDWEDGKNSLGLNGPNCGDTFWLSWMV